MFFSGTLTNEVWQNGSWKGDLNSIECNSMWTNRLLWEKENAAGTQSKRVQFVLEHHCIDADVPPSNLTNVPMYPQRCTPCTLRDVPMYPQMLYPCTLRWCTHVPSEMYPMYPGKKPYKIKKNPTMPKLKYWKVFKNLYGIVGFFLDFVGFFFEVHLVHLSGYTWYT